MKIFVALLASVSLAAANPLIFLSGNPPVVTGGAITFNAVTSAFAANQTTASGGAIVLTHTISSTLTNGYIFVDFAFWDGASAADFTSVTFDGVTMTKLQDYAFTTDVNNQVYQFGLAVGSKAPGTYDIFVNFSGAGSTVEEFNVGCRSYNGVNQSTPTGTAAVAQGTGTTTSVTVTSVSGDLVVDTVLLGEAATATGTGHTERWDTGATGGATHGAGGDMPATTTSTVPGWTITSTNWIAAGIALKPAP